MTNEKMFKIITKLKDDYTSDNFDVSYVDKVLNELKEDLKKEYQKSKGLKHGAVLKKLFKEGYNKNEKFMNKAIVVDDARVFTNGFSIYWLNDNYGYEELIDTKLKDIMTSFKEKYINNGLLYHEIEIDVVDLKLHNTNNKALKKNEPYIIEYGNGECIGLNGEYLINVLDIIGTTTIYVNEPCNPIYCKNINNECGLVCPMIINR